MVLASTERTAHTPHLPLEAFGIELVAEQTREGQPSGVLGGAYRLPRSEADGLGHPLLVRLGLVAQRPYGDPGEGVSHFGAAVATPFAKQLLFEDDVMTTPGSVEGAFRVDFREAFKEELEPGVWIVFAVLGVHSSTPIQVEI